jgi:hypothetical protein
VHSRQAPESITAAKDRDKLKEEGDENKRTKGKNE